MLLALKKEKLRNPPGTRFVYSDIGFIVLGEIIGRVTNPGLPAFPAMAIFEPTGMSQTGYFTSQEWTHVSFQRDRLRVAPTENVRGQNSYLGAKFQGEEAVGNEILRGQVHDPTAYRMNGFAGHAGLFSTADDLARYCQMLLNGGVAPAPVRTGSGSDRGSLQRPARKQGRDRRVEHYALTNVRASAASPALAGGTNTGARILSAQTVAKMTAPYVVSEDGATRGLGWDMNTSFSSNRGELFPLGSFGHTGFTGTS